MLTSKNFIQVNYVDVWHKADNLLPIGKSNIGLVIYIYYIFIVVHWCNKVLSQVWISNENIYKFEWKTSFIYIVRSYVVLLYHCPMLGGGLGSRLHVKPRHIMYICACPKSGACNSVVVVCFICATYLFFFINKVVSFLVWIVLHCHFGAFYSWLCGMGFAHCWRPYGGLYLLSSVSFWSLVKNCLIGNHITYLLLNVPTSFEIYALQNHCQLK